MDWRTTIRTDWLKRQPGVESVRTNIVEAVVFVFGWLERERDHQALPAD
jgi:hypothetical protein